MVGTGTGAKLAVAREASAAEKMLCCENNITPRMKNGMSLVENNYNIASYHGGDMTQGNMLSGSDSRIQTHAARKEYDLQFRWQEIFAQHYHSICIQFCSYGIICREETLKYRNKMMQETG